MSVEAVARPIAKPARVGLHVRGEVFAIVAAFAAFPLVALARPGTADEAMERGVGFEQLERSWGLDLRQPLVDWASRQDVVELLANAFYYSAHVSVLIGLGIITAVRHPMRYRRLRTLFLTAHAMTIACYLGWPTAPPRLLPPTGVDGQGPFSSVQYTFAAFPSGHVVFAIIVSIALFSSRRPWVRMIGMSYPVVVALVTLVTNNHHMIDLLGAAVVVIASVGVTAAPRLFTPPRSPRR